MQNANNEVYYWYDYDNQGRLKEVRSSMHNNKTTSRLECVYSYSTNDQVSKVEYKSVTGRVEEINYTYDQRNWLKQIKSTSLINGQTLLTRFEENLSYYKNGNIDSLLIKNYGNGSWGDLSFKHNYDGLSRLTAVTNLNGIFSETYNYDADGNFTSKSRTGNTVSYSYGGNNRLNTVSINGGSALNYTYDARGNLLTDTRRSTSFSQYDHRNLPLRVTRSGVNINYYYDDMGNRIAKSNISTNHTDYYLRDHTGRELTIYSLENTGIELDMAHIYGNGLIGRIDAYWEEIEEEDPETGGVYYVMARTDERSYYIKDHLGSIRQTFSSYGAITNAQDYYPFGETIRSVTGDMYRDKYKFTEKERDTETGYDYFGARYYDSYIGRWLSVDPLADKYPGWSPYNYTMNNPVRYIDPNGMEVDWYLDQEGVPQYDANVQNQNDLQSGETYLGEQGFAFNEQTGEIVQMNADGTSTSGSFTLSNIEVTSEVSSVLGTVLTGIGIGQATTETVLGWAEKLDDSFKISGAFKIAGKAFGAYSILESGLNTWYNPSLKNITKLGINIGCSVASGATAGLANGLLEVTGVKENVLNGVFGK